MLRILFSIFSQISKEFKTPGQVIVHLSSKSQTKPHSDIRYYHWFNHRLLQWHFFWSSLFSSELINLKSMAQAHVHTCTAVWSTSALHWGSTGNGILRYPPSWWMGRVLNLTMTDIQNGKIKQIAKIFARKRNNCKHVVSWGARGRKDVSPFFVFGWN